MTSTQTSADAQSAAKSSGPVKAIEVTGLSKTFGRSAKALDNVSIDIARGEMVALIGASGSGKSTLLRHISGLLFGDRANAAGNCDVRVFGELVQSGGKPSRNIRQIRSRIGFIFQQFNLVTRLSVIKNVLVGRLGALPKRRTLLFRFTDEEKMAALRALDQVGIANHAFKRASALSGGQQQRAAIARTIVQGADIVLADEPIASLDPESSRVIMDMLRGLNTQNETTVVVSLHQVDFAVNYCPRTVALRDGKIVYDGPSKNLTKQLLKELYGSSADELFGTNAVDDMPTTSGAGHKDSEAASGNVVPITAPANAVGS